MQELKVMVGIPASGKTTLAKTFVQTRGKDKVAYISRDEIRFSMLKNEDEYFAEEHRVFSEYVRQVREALDQGYEIVIADATHLSAGSRRKLLSQIPNQQKCKLTYEVINCPYEIAAARNAKREGRARVPDAALISMYKSFKIPGFKESYNFNDFSINIYTVKE